MQTLEQWFNVRMEQIKLTKRKMVENASTHTP